MNIQCIAEHSVDVDLINEHSKILDLGARAFTWSREMLYHFNLDTIYCVDADSEVTAPDERFNFLNVAVGHENGRQPFIKYGNGTGNYLSDGTEIRPREHKMEFVEVWTIAWIWAYFGAGWWDVIKFDVEGAEYEILHNLEAPIATQLSAEFHQHTHKRVSMEYLHEIRNNLSQWYDCVVCDYSEQHGSGLNVWDSLFILKPEYRKTSSHV